jgi:hypothetical protein
MPTATTITTGTNTLTDTIRTDRKRLSVNWTESVIRLME